VRPAVPPLRVPALAPAPVAPEPAKHAADLGHPRAGPPEAYAKSTVTEGEVADILDLTESMATSPPPEPAASASPAFRTIDGNSDIVFNDEPVHPAPASRMEEPRRPSAPSYADRELLSSRATAAVDSAFNSLAHTVLEQNARTLEDLVREMLRPMLKVWLDDNLPSMVERLVRAEIERVSRGRG
jgi:cell pole-organizing protein PopZ